MTHADAAFRVGDKVRLIDEEGEEPDTSILAGTQWEESGGYPGVIVELSEDDAHLNGEDGRVPKGPFGDPRPHYNVLFTGTDEPELVPEDFLEAM